MSAETITFNCPACNIKLTVPVSFAGVTGPCPTCRSIIQAPYSLPVQVPVHVPDKIVPVSALLMPVDHSPSRTLPIQESALSSLPIDVNLADSTPSLVRVGKSFEAMPSPSSSSQRPEAKQLPNRDHNGDPIAQLVNEPISENLDWKAPDPLELRPSAKSQLVRLLIVILFVLAAGVLIYGIVILFNKQSPQNLPVENITVETKPSQSLPSQIKPNKQEHLKNPSLPEPKPLSPPITAPTPQPTPQATVTPSSSQSKESETAASIMTTNEVLRKFLAAQTLEERLNFMETQTPQDELSNSCLAKALPATGKISINAQESHADRKVIDSYYSVDFLEADQNINSQNILVRKRDNNNPKVVADPFLDSFGGRLKSYAQSPLDKTGIFQVTVTPVPSCDAKDIPNPEDKITLKLLAGDNAKEITRAYFGKQSEVGKLLDSGRSGLSYGKAEACTVLLKWNTQDKVSQPYLEALAVTTLDWNL